MSERKIQTRGLVLWMGVLALGLWILLPADGLAQTCDEQLAQCQLELSACLADTDADSVPDIVDPCPNTRVGPANVDLFGCSHEEFCNRILVPDSQGRRNCRRADWKSDESGKFMFRPRDCRVNRGNPKKPFNRTDDRCVSR